VIQNPGFLPDHAQNWITGSLCHARHTLKISEGSVHNFSSYRVHSQTNKQTNKNRQKHYLLGGGNKPLSFCDNTMLLFCFPVCTTRPDPIVLICKEQDKSGNRETIQSDLNSFNKMRSVMSSNIIDHSLYQHFKAARHETLSLCVCLVEWGWRRWFVNDCI